MKHFFSQLTLCALALHFVACQSSERQTMSDVNPGLAETNPAAEGFNQAASDSTALRLADEVMQAMGGRQAWDDTRYVAWNFFGARSLLWDKHTGDVRIEVPKDSAIYLFNIAQDTGQVMMRGTALTNADSLQKYVERGKQMWVNDSYWLFMPFKLKDSGVTLTYVGNDTLQNGSRAEVVELQFADVGFTPDNKYRVYIDPSDSLVKQWAYYPKASMDTPQFVTPWQDYQTYGNILLSGDRGERQISDIQVMETVPEDAFESMEFQL